MRMFKSFKYLTEQGCFFSPIFMRAVVEKKKLLKCVVLALLSVNSFGHGLVSTTAEVSLRPHNLIEVQVQFDFSALLNHNSNAYSLSLLASLNDEKFGLLYGEVIKLFDRRLIVKNKGIPIDLHRRYPTQEQVFGLLKQQFIESTMGPSQFSLPYTYSDRRFYQLAFFDLKLNSSEDLKNLEITFPPELGDVYVTFNEPKTVEVHKGKAWSYGQNQER